MRILLVLLVLLILGNEPRPNYRKIVVKNADVHKVRSASSNDYIGPSEIIFKDGYRVLVRESYFDLICQSLEVSFEASLK